MYKNAVSMRQYIMDENAYQGREEIVYMNTTMKYLNKKNNETITMPTTR